MLRVSQTDQFIHIDSFEDAPAVAHLRVDDQWIFKPINPGANLFPCEGMLMDIELLAMAKADIAPLYVCRHVINANDIILWFKGQGFGAMLRPEDMHVTICYSRQPVDWTGFDPAPSALMIGGEHPRSIEALGKGPAVVMKFNADVLQARHAHMRSRGATSDYPDYQPHITLSYKLNNRDLSQYEPFPFPLALGPEVYEDINTERDFIEKAAVKRFTWDRVRGLRARPQ
jgi:hypothetical protein